jgi:hypothetical protein
MVSKTTRTKRDNPPGRRAVRAEMTNVNLCAKEHDGYRRIVKMKQALDIKTGKPVLIARVTLRRVLGAV